MIIRLCITLVVTAQLLLASYTTIDNSIVGQNIKTMSAGRTSFIVSTQSKGISVYDMETKRKLSDIPINRKYRTGLMYSSIMYKSTIYIGSSHGLSVYNSKTGLLTAHYGRKELGIDKSIVYSLAIKNNELLIGSSSAITIFNMSRKKVTRVLQNSLLTKPVVSIKAIGNQIFMGTNGNGVVVFDNARQKWSDITMLDGLPSNIINDILLYGSNAYIATQKGLVRYTLDKSEISIVTKPIQIISLALYNSLLYASSLGKLYAVDLNNNHSLTGIEVDSKNHVLIEKIITTHDGLILATDGLGLLYKKEAFQSVSPTAISYAQSGVSLTYPQDLFNSLQVTSFNCWYPDLPNAYFSSENVVKDSVNRTFTIALPPELSGNLVFEIVITHEKGYSALITHELYRDNIPPAIELAQIPEFTNKSIVHLRASTQDNDIETITLQPGNKPLKLNSNNEVYAKLKLKPGLNEYTIDIIDIAGNQTELPIAIYFDKKNPIVEIFNQPENVTQPTIALTGSIQEEHIQTVTVSPSDKAQVTLFNNTLNVNVYNMSHGMNKFIVTVKDKANNSTDYPLNITYTDQNKQEVKAVMSLQRDLENVQKNKTEYTQKNSVKPIEITYIIKKNDTFRKLGNRFYGNAEMGSVVARYNNIDVYKEYKELRVGRVIKIPMYRDFKFGKMHSTIELNRTIKGR
ncbi:MAG: hypothetical protein OCD01_17785 [Fibrobacterales bacterium]